jgi:hypothetical protein
MGTVKNSISYETFASEMELLTALFFWELEDRSRWFSTGCSAAESCDRIVDRPALPCYAYGTEVAWMAVLHKTPVCTALGPSQSCRSKDLKRGGRRMLNTGGRCHAAGA